MGSFFLDRAVRGHRRMLAAAGQRIAYQVDAEAASVELAAVGEDERTELRVVDEVQVEVRTRTWYVALYELEAAGGVKEEESAVLDGDTRYVVVRVRRNAGVAVLESERGRPVRYGNQRGEVYG